MAIEEAKKQKTALKKELAGKFEHLKMDACTSSQLNYFAINVHRFGDDSHFGEDSIVKTKTFPVGPFHVRSPNGLNLTLSEFNEIRHTC